MQILVALILLLIVPAGFASLSGAPWLPTRARDMDSLFQLCSAKRGETLVELGCGDGRVLIEAAKRGINSVGYEINPLFWLITWVRGLRYGKKIRVRLGSFWSADLSEADIVMIFLIPRKMQKLENMLNGQMKNGSRFVSYVFELPHKKPQKRHKPWILYKY